MKWGSEIVQMSLLFIGEVSHSSLHATNHLSSMQNSKCATCHLHLMHLVTCQCMQPSTLPQCVTWEMQLVLHVGLAMNRTNSNIVRNSIRQLIRWTWFMNQMSRIWAKN